jgi:hypothetical protein
MARWMAVPGLLLMAACGGSSGPTPVPTTTMPAPPPPRVVLQGSTPLRAGFAAGAYFTTDRVGTIEATVDYTFTASQIHVWIATGQCTAELFGAEQCTFATSSFAGAKPRVLTLTGAAAGTYTLVMANLGPDDEAVSVQVVFTPSAGAASNESRNLTPARPGAWSRKLN